MFLTTDIPVGSETSAMRSSINSPAPCWRNPSGRSSDLWWLGETCPSSGGRTQSQNQPHWVLLPAVAAVSQTHSSTIKHRCHYTQHTSVLIHTPSLWCVPSKTNPHTCGVSKLQSTINSPGLCWRNCSGCSDLWQRRGRTGPSSGERTQSLQP